MGKQRERLDRLLKKQPDGSYKVVGFMKVENGRIYHKSVKDNKWNDILCISYRGRSYFIKHDRVDQYTGISIDRVKVFENDVLESIKGIERMVKFTDGGFVLASAAQGIFAETPLEASVKNAKITGIEGVNND